MREEEYKKQVNEWIISLNSSVNELQQVIPIVKEHEESIDHNYEILCELRNDVRKIREELNALRIIELLNIKSSLSLSHNPNKDTKDKMEE